MEIEDEGGCRGNMLKGFVQTLVDETWCMGTRRRRSEGEHLEGCSIDDAAKSDWSGRWFVFLSEKLIAQV